MAHRLWSLEQWKKVFRDIYEFQNLHYSLDEVLHRLIEESAELVRPILTYNKKQIKRHLPDIFGWVCAFANKYNIDLERAMESKYVQTPPGKPKWLRLPPSDVTGRVRLETLEDWQRYLGSLYKYENENISPTLILSRLIEDIGITSRNLRKREDHGCTRDKLTGVLGWTIALANKFQIRLDDTAWKKYPNFCWKCQSKPCKCFSLTTIFISYTTDTEEEMLKVKNLIGEQLKLRHKAFEELGPAFQKVRMVEVFHAINKSDGAVVLVKKRWSEKVYAELMHILTVMDKHNVWICAHKDSKRDRELQDLLKELQLHHRIDYYQNIRELIAKMRSNIRNRLRERPVLTK